MYTSDAITFTNPKDGSDIPDDQAPIFDAIPFFRVEGFTVVEERDPALAKASEAPAATPACAPPDLPDPPAISDLAKLTDIHIPPLSTRQPPAAPPARNHLLTHTSSRRLAAGLAGGSSCAAAAAAAASTFAVEIRTSPAGFNAGRVYRLRGAAAALRGLCRDVPALVRAARERFEAVSRWRRAQARLRAVYSSAAVQGLIAALIVAVRPAPSHPTHPPTE